MWSGCTFYCSGLLQHLLSVVNKSRQEDWYLKGFWSIWLFPPFPLDAIRITSKVFCVIHVELRLGRRAVFPQPQEFPRSFDNTVAMGRLNPPLFTAFALLRGFINLIMAVWNPCLTQGCTWQVIQSFGSDVFPVSRLTPIKWHLLATCLLECIMQLRGHLFNCSICLSLQAGVANLRFLISMWLSHVPFLFGMCVWVYGGTGTAGRCGLLAGLLQFVCTLSPTTCFLTRASVELLRLFPGVFWSSLLP